MNFIENKISILHTGYGWISVYKPPSVSVHNDPGNDLLFHSKQMIKDLDLFDKISFDSSFGLNPVHRLDKETSGVIILSCRKDIFRHFSKQFESHEIDKRYTVLVHGEINSRGWESWDTMLSKQSGGRKNIRGKGKKIPCETRYKVLENCPHYTLLEIQLVTGRKHQIRRHAAISGHPVVGDQRYGSKRAVKFLKERLSFERLCLHSYSISIELMDGDKKNITIVNVPDSIKDLMAIDRKTSESLE